jgi:WD40 repeat protein
MFIRDIDLCNCSLVCLSWYNLIATDDIWFFKCLTNHWTEISSPVLEDPYDPFQSEIEPTFTVKWKIVYIENKTSQNHWLKGSYLKKEIKRTCKREIKRVDTNHDIKSLKNELSVRSLDKLSFENSGRKLINAHDDMILCVATDTTKIITASKDSSIRVWKSSIESGSNESIYEIILEENRSSGKHFITALDFSESHIITGSNKGCLSIWNVFNGELLCHLTKGMLFP